MKSLLANLQPKSDEDIISEIKNYDEWTQKMLLHEAFARRNYRNIKLMLEHSIVQIERSHYEKYVFDSIKRNRVKFFDILNDHGIVNEGNCNKFLRAAAYFSLPIVKKLLRFPNIDPTEKGKTKNAIDIAREYRKTETLKLLKDFVIKSRLPCRVAQERDTVAVGSQLPGTGV